MKSTNDECYYVLFVDNATKYNWWFPMKNKPDVLQIFITFKNQIERQLDRKIRQLQMDNRGEFLALKDFLDANGISHLQACPHAHQQMGAVEQRHHHIVDTGLTLLSHAKLQHDFWSYAFATVAFSYNQMTSDYLAGDSPYKRLYQ